MCSSDLVALFHAAEELREADPDRAADASEFGRVSDVLAALDAHVGGAGEPGRLDHLNLSPVLVRPLGANEGSDGVGPGCALAHVCSHERTVVPP